MRFGMKAILALCLILSLTTLSACRYSDTLLEIIRDPAGTLEPRANPEYREVEGAPEKTNLASLHLSENENFAEQDNFLPVYKEEADMNGTAVRRQHQEVTPNSTDASEGNEYDDKEEDNTSTSEETEQNEIDSSGEGDSTEEKTSEDGEGEKADKTAGRGGTGQVYGDGSYEELPDSRALAARGQYALIAQMLGGKGALAATDQSFIEKTKNSGAFPDEGVEEIPVVWDSNGVLNMETLIASEADAILVDGVEIILTEEEKERLTAEGFNIVYVPMLGNTYTQDKDIVDAVKVVGQVLSGLNSQSSYSTSDMAAKYVELHDNAINGCLNANGGYSYKMVNGTPYKAIYQGTSPLGEDTARLSDNRTTTVCIDTWAPSTGSTIMAKRAFGFHEMYLDEMPLNISDGVGLSATSVGGNFILSDYYFQVIGIVNNSYDSPKPTSSTDGSQQSNPYPITAGSPEGITARQIAYRQIPSALWYSQTGISPTDRWIIVGEADFPGVIVRDAAMAQNVQRSASKVNGLYNVGQPYKIYQMPKGIAGNWFDGNVESFLISLWAFDSLINPEESNSQEWVEGFYRLFYRISDNAVSHLEGYNVVLTAACPRG